MTTLPHRLPAGEARSRVAGRPTAARPRAGSDRVPGGGEALADRQPREAGTAAFVPARVPGGLLPLPWVAWKYAPQPGKTKPKKVPINPRIGRPASVTDPRTWDTYPAACAAVGRFGLTGVGVVLTRTNRLTGVDLDDCYDPVTGRFEDWAVEILAHLPDTYAEFSPSGRGVQLFVAGSLPPSARNKVGRVEAYSERHYLTVTGRILPGRPRAITDAAGGLMWLVGKYLTPAPSVVPVAVSSGYTGGDAELVRKACAHPVTGPRLAALLDGNQLGHPSPSEADYELCRILGFGCGRDPVRVERIARASAAYRPKWDRPWGDTSWIGQTIRNALARVRRVYAPDSPHTPLTKHREDKSVSHPAAGPSAGELVARPIPAPEPASPPGPFTPPEQADKLLAHVRALRLRHRRPVGLSVRQAATAIGASHATAARRMKDLVQGGRLILVKKGGYKTARASVYDVPESAPPPAPGSPVCQPPTRCTLGRPGIPPPYTRTPGGLYAVWWWSPRRREWRHFGDCPSQAAADALAGRHMARRSG